MRTFRKYYIKIDLIALGSGCQDLSRSAQGPKIFQGHLKYQFVFMIMIIKEFIDISKYKI